MPRMRVPARTVLTILMLGLTLAGLATSASAHTRLAAPVLEPAPIVPVPAAPVAPLATLQANGPAAATLWPLLLLATALGLVLALPRRALVIALVFVVAVLAVETSIHSVHHLADRQTAAQCAIAQASAHVNGVMQAPALLDAGAPTLAGGAPVVEPERPDLRSLRPDEGRAPPAA